MSIWRLSRGGTNYPSIAHRGVSCSKVGLGEPVPNMKIIIGSVLKTNLEFIS